MNLRHPSPRNAARLVAALALAFVLPASMGLGQARTTSQQAAASRERVEAPAGVAEITSLEQFLGRALAAHPQIVAAEAAVESAEAELRRTRFEVARELIVFYNDWKATKGEVARTKALFEKGAASIDEMVKPKSRLDKMESQLPYLLGTASAARPGRAGTTREAGPKRLPQGPQVEKIFKLLDEPAELDFIQTPLQDFVDTVKDYHKVEVTADPAAADVPLTVSIKGIPMGAALQMVEDVTPGIRFVVTDYGILATTDVSEHASRYISANEFWREHRAEGGEVAAPKAKDKAKAPSTAPADPFSAPIKPDAKPNRDAPVADPFAPAKAQPKSPFEPADP